MSVQQSSVLRQGHVKLPKGKTQVSRPLLSTCPAVRLSKRLSGTPSQPTRLAFGKRGQHRSMHKRNAGKGEEPSSLRHTVSQISGSSFCEGQRGFSSRKR